MRAASARTAGDAELRAALAPLRQGLVRACGFSLAAGMLALAPSAYMLEVYDRVVNSRNPRTLLMLTGAVLFAYLVMQGLEWVHHALLHEGGLALERRLRDRVFNASLQAQLRGLPVPVTQPLEDLRSLREFTEAPLLKAVMESPLSLLFLALVFAIHPWLGCAALAGGLLQLALTALNERATQAPLSAAQGSARAAQAQAEAMLRNAQVIAAMGMLPQIRRRWHGRQREFLGLQALASDRAGLYTSLVRAVQLAWSSLLLGLAAWLLLQGALHGGGGMLVVASVVGGLLLKPLAVIVGQWRSVVQVRGAWRRLAELFTLVPPRLAAMPLPPARGQLTADNLVLMAPGTQSPLLQGVSFSLEPGELLAVIGPSGAGKSCLARALVGLWPSAGGKARLDGADLYTWDKAQLGPGLGWLPQEVELFEGTLGENIARFGEADPVKLHEAVHAAGLEDLLAALPLGLDTPLADGGAPLSGGQRQRVGLARALYGDPALVVLDEPNASLDEAGDLALLQSIRQAKARGASLVVVTQRAHLIEVADKLLLLQGGRMHAVGPRHEVLAAMETEMQAARRPVTPRMGAAS